MSTKHTTNGLGGLGRVLEAEGRSRGSSPVRRGASDISRDNRIDQFLKPVSKVGTITQAQADKIVRDYRSKK